MDRVMTTSVAVTWSSGHRTTVPFLSHVCPYRLPASSTPTFGPDDSEVGQEPIGSTIRPGTIVLVSRRRCELPSSGLAGADVALIVAVFLNPLTEHQRAVLGDLFDCLVMSNEDLLIPDR
jgi:hypothetical protein